MVIALTGGTGSGKGYVCETLKELGGYIIDADYIAHNIIKKGKPAYKEILDYFVVKNNFNILDNNEEIIRKELGKIVFSDKNKLSILNQCTHKHIEIEILNQVKTAKNNNEKFIFIDIPLLEKGKTLDSCNKVWSVFAPEEQRINRIINRDNISIEVATGRINSQNPWEYYEKLSDLVIDNSDNVVDLKSSIEKAFKELEKSIGVL